MDVAEVVQMFQAGLSADSIATELAISIKEVKRILIEAGVMMKAGRKSSADTLTQEDRKRIIELYVEGKIPAIQIIGQYELTWNSFYSVLDSEGIPFREIKSENRLARQLRLDRAVEMYIGNARIWEIENETGIRQPVLHSELHKRSVPLRRQSNS